jgi:hypothetical protein
MSSLAGHMAAQGGVRSENQGGSEKTVSSSTTQAQLPVLGGKRSLAGQDGDEASHGPAKRMAISSILSSSRGDEGPVAHQAAARATGSTGSSDEPVSAKDGGQAKVRSGSEQEGGEGSSGGGGLGFLRFLRCLEDRGIVVRQMRGEGHLEEVVGWTVVEGRMEEWRTLRKEWFMNGKEGKVYKPNSMYQVMRRLGFFPTLQTRRTSHGYDFEYSDAYVLDKGKRYVQSHGPGGLPLAPHIERAELQASLLLCTPEYAPKARGKAIGPAWPQSA